MSNGHWFEVTSETADPSTGVFPHIAVTISLPYGSEGRFFANNAANPRTAYRYAGRRDGSDYGNLMLESVAQTSTTYRQGTTSYGSVVSQKSNAYPTNGRHSDGYWYLKQS